jgi:hypothetical protein
MSVIVPIAFNSDQIPQRDYYDRLFVELRQYDDITDYLLRAIDVESNNAV